MNFESLPDDITPDYVNEQAELKLAELLDSPDYARLADFMNSLKEGYLVVDVTGTAHRKKGTRIRTTRSTSGQPVLPLFTSMEKLRAANSSKGRKSLDVKGAILPALEALKLIETDRFVACEVNPGTTPLVVLRKYVQLLFDEAPVTPEVLEGLKK